MPEKQRAAMPLRVNEELSYGEISEVLSISVSAVESLIFRARARLRKLLEKKIEESAPCNGKNFPGPPDFEPPIHRIASWSAVHTVIKLSTGYATPYAICHRQRRSMTRSNRLQCSNLDAGNGGGQVFHDLFRQFQVDTDRLR